jgi:hypothetical protein
MNKTQPAFSIKSALPVHKQENSTVQIQQVDEDGKPIISNKPAKKLSAQHGMAIHSTSSNEDFF